MKIFNNLEIYNSSEELLSLLRQIKDNLPPDWSYKKEFIEPYVKNTSKSIDEVLCVESPIILEVKGLVWIGIWEECLKVINIVPTKPGSLSYDQYNAILDVFYQDCIKKYITDEKISYNTKGKDIATICGTKTFEKMAIWESNCNHSTGNTNPHDFERWSAFVITAHREKSKLTSDWFERWLVEEKGWSMDFDITTRLVLEYEYSRDLLEENDKY